MKKQISKSLGILLALAMALTLAPPAALAAGTDAAPTITLAAADGDKSGTGWSWNSSRHVLTLNDYSGGAIHVADDISYLALLLEGENTLTYKGRDSDVYGVYCPKSHLTIEDNTEDCTASLTIQVENSNTSDSVNYGAYGIYAGSLDLESGALDIAAKVYTETTQKAKTWVCGVYTGSGAWYNGGAVDVAVTGRGYGYGVYCASGGLGVGCDMTVDVTNKGPQSMYAVYSDATTAAEGNGDVYLGSWCDLTVTRNSASGSDSRVYGVANSSGANNTDGVIHIEGGKVRAVNTSTAILARTQSHATAFADVVIDMVEVTEQRATVTVTSDRANSHGITSNNNGVAISNSTVALTTQGSALLLWDNDASAKTGLLTISGSAQVDLVSTAESLALVVYGDTGASSTRVHRIDLAGGGYCNVTTDLTGTDEVTQGYFALGENTALSVGALSTETNAGGGHSLLQNCDQVLAVTAYPVTITPGQGMYIDMVEDDPAGEKVDEFHVLYHAAEGYYFPTDYFDAVAPMDGVALIRDNAGAIEVKSTRVTGPVTLTLPAATPKAKEPAPNIDFQIVDETQARLENCQLGTEYSLDGGAHWTELTEEDRAPGPLSDVFYLVEDLTPGMEVWFRRPTTDVDTKMPSDPQKFSIAQPEPPKGLTTVPCLNTDPGEENGKIVGTTADMELRPQGVVSWSGCTGGEETGLVPGVYEVRYGTKGAALPSQSVTVTVGGPDRVEYDKATGKVTVAVTKADEYTVIFANYDHGRLTDLRTRTMTVLAGTVAFPLPDGFDLHSGGKLFLLTTSSSAPWCLPFVAP